MRETFSWLKKIVRGEKRDMVALLTPEVVRERGPVTRFLVAGGTLIGMVTAALVGAVALAILLVAIGIVYFLATQVLGLKVNVDPQAFYQQFQRQAAAYGAN